MDSGNGIFIIESTECKLDVEIRHLKRRRVLDQSDEYIKFIDNCQKQIEKNSGIKRIMKSEVLRLFGMGVILPTIDVWTDFYLAAKLHIATHER